MSRAEAIRFAVSYGDNGRFLADLAKRVAIPTESQNPERLADCYRYLRLFGQDLAALGFENHIIDNPSRCGGPYLIARRIENAGLPTLLVYGHGDVVLGMEGRWSNDRNPWDISVEGDRIYGRGTADNKGQHTIVALALEAVLNARETLGYNVVFLIETSEETGSAGLYQTCEAYRDLLRADWLIASDGPRLIQERPTLDGGTRGSYDFDLICDLREGGHHSGNWGGLIANPATILCNAIASLISEEGQIRVRGILPQSVPSTVSAALREIQVEQADDGPRLDPWWGEAGLTPSERVFGWTALEVLAMTAGTPDHPVNAIPPRAQARMQIRYTVDVDPTTFQKTIRDFLDEKGFNRVQLVSRSDDNDWGATRLDPGHPLMQWAAASVEKTTGQKPTILPNAGGSLPNNCFADLLGIPTIWVPHSYSGCNQHAPNEHLLMPLVREGLAIMTGLFWDLGTEARPEIIQK
ncbi:acetylornithine deacetylase/succinyl-diaminopimelate desuccinylase-like protein [Phyllobacterium myrsinacearum]|uniref:M20 family metallopeptidase n=1 Tax=Phyllobacterium myrsinacearum TaxID=28101 RepID=UPI00102A1E0C|nr:M20 family metallopeptidase [Phyllobacterium myrsinacearum]RZS77814.1 acetylornithine deacetylase/succinyl-diaminopimelate desuccinylase-like protein [Phyllobacterium myrsinacearum]